MFVSKMFGNKGRVPYFQQAGFESQDIKPSVPRAQVAHDQAEWAAKFWRAVSHLQQCVLGPTVPMIFVVMFCFAGLKV